MNASGPIQYLRIAAAAVADARGVLDRVTTVLLQCPTGASIDKTGSYIGKCRVVATGTPAEIDAHPGTPQAVRINRTGCLLIPALVNAHAHLDLTHIGPQPFDPSQGFPGFIDTVRRGRATSDQAIADSVRHGAQLSLAGGVVAVGDIAGAPFGRPTLTPWQTLAQNLPLGISYFEFFAMGLGEIPARERLSQLLHTNRQFLAGAQDVRFGLQPHAPATIAYPTYRWLQSQEPWKGLPFSTHLAETPGEHEFIAHGTGAQTSFLKALGLWDDSILDHIAKGQTPIAHLAGLLSSRFLCAHVNDCSDADLALLAASGAHVVYCPRASEYFAAAAHFGLHRYQDMLAAGINVCLGTDSIINLPPGTDRLSTLDEARLLYQRDGADAAQLLGMATTHGAKALGIATPSLALNVGDEIAGLVAIPLTTPGNPKPLHDALSSTSPPELLVRWPLSHESDPVPHA